MIPFNIGVLQLSMEPVQETVHEPLGKSQETVEAEKLSSSELTF